MKIFLKYCMQNRKAFFLFFGCMLLFGMIFWLYSLEIEAYLYGCVLCFILFIVYLGKDFSVYYKSHHVWKKIEQCALLQMDLSKTTEDEDLKAVFIKINEELNELIAENDRKKEDLMDYFTMWIHQVKLPLSAMELMLANQGLSISQWKQQVFAIERYLSMMLAYLRMKSDSSDFVIKEFELDRIIRKSIHTFSLQFIYKKIKLEFQETNLRVLSDEKWLEFVIEQILSNAIKYSAAGSTIEIYNRGQDLIIQDHGCGIEKSDLKRIMEKGFTGNNGRMDQGQSSGLGLYLVYSILKKLNHPLSIESKPNQGTKVILHLENNRQNLE